MLLISRLINRSGLRISHSKVFNSDHLPVFSLFKCTQHEDNIGSKPVLIRNISIENKSKFNEKLLLNDWTHVMINEDSSTAFSEFSNILNNIYEESFPFIKYKPNKSKILLTLALRLLCSI